MDDVLFNRFNQIDVILPTSLCLLGLI